MQFETTVLGGLPVIVECVVNPAEPDIGIFSRYAEIERISFAQPRRVKGRLCYVALPSSMMVKLERNGDIGRIVEEADAMIGW